METKEKKVYLSNMKPIGQTGGLKGMINLSKIDPKNIETNANGDQIIRFAIWPNREPDRYGNTHSMQLDTWKPTQKKEEIKGLPF